MGIFFALKLRFHHALQIMVHFVRQYLCPSTFTCVHDGEFCEIFLQNFNKKKVK